MKTGVAFEVSKEQRRRLEMIAADGNSKQKHARRARIILLSDDGLGTMVIVAATGSTTTHRILADQKLAPHRMREFKVSTDPDFAERTRATAGLYMNPLDRAVVLSIDEKTQVQALGRTQQGLAMKPGQPVTMTHDYKRNGAVTLFAALNTLDGTVIGRHADCRRHQEFIEFLDQIEAEVPAGRDIHAIVDNTAAHKHGAVRKWLAEHRRWPLDTESAPLVGFGKRGAKS